MSRALVPSIHHASQLKLWATHVARASTLLALLLLPFSHFIVNQALMVATLASLLSGNFAEKWHHLKQYKSLGWMLAFVAMLLISLTYTDDSFGHAVSVFSKFTKLLFILFLFSLFESERFRKVGMNLFLYGVTIATFLSYLSYFNLVDYHPFFEAHRRLITRGGDFGLFILITLFSVFQAFCIYLLTTRILKKENIAVSVILLAFIGAHLFYFNVEKTGCIAALVLILLAVYQFAPRKLLLWLIALITVGLTLMVVSSATLKTRLHEFYSSFAHKIVVPSTSTELSTTQYRIAFAKSSWQIIKTSPWIGTGVGSFTKQYKAVHGVQLPNVDLYEPHDDFIFITVQVGFIGLALFLVFLVMLWRDFSSLAFYEKCIGHAVIVLFTINALCNAALIANPTGIFYVLMISMLLGSKVKRIDTTTH